jgi:predicted RNA binding protein YcfA (HicA-like mRNA interferase family)
MKQVSGGNLIRIACQHGWSINRIKGSHHVLVKEGEALIVTIPVHGNKPLKIGLLRALMKQLQLSESDL